MKIIINISFVKKFIQLTIILLKKLHCSIILAKKVEKYIK